MTPGARTRLIQALMTLAMVGTLLRNFRSPDPYAVGQWLLSDEFGLIKRGLVGTVLEPLYAYKTPAEITFLIATLSSVVLAALVVLIVQVSAPLIEQSAREPGPTRWMLLGGLALLSTSSWLTFVGHTNGFFDHHLEVITLLGLLLMRTRAQFLLPVLMLAGVLTHELFLVYGAPALVGAWVIDSGQQNRRMLTGLVAMLLALSLGVALLWHSADGWDPASLERLHAKVASYGVLHGQDVDNALFHLEHGWSSTLETQAGRVPERLARWDIARVVVGPALWLSAATMLRLLRARRWLAASIVLPVSLAPMALHWVAWDTPRFTLMVVFQSWCLWCAAARLELVSGTLRVHLALAATAWLLAATGLVQHVPLMQDLRDGSGVLMPRTKPTRQSFDGCRPLFPNADFEQGGLRSWTPEGAAFDDASVRLGHTALGGRTLGGSIGDWWLGSYGLDHDDLAGAHDRNTGTLTSRPFTIDGDTILVAVGGGRNLQRLRVALVVGGEEVRRATGRDKDDLVAHAWNVRSIAGATAMVRITDEATGPWGHLNVDGLCYFRSSLTAERIQSTTTTGRAITLR